MLLMVIAAMLAADRAPGLIIADVIALQAQFKHCLANRTVEIGAANREAAETVLRAAASTCRPVEQSLRDVYDEIPLGAAWAERLMARDRKLGEDDGVARLLAVRAARQPR